MRAGEEIRPVTAAGSGWIVKDRTWGRRGFRRSRDESNPVGGGAKLNARNFFADGGEKAPSGVQRGGKIGGGKVGRVGAARSFRQVLSVGLIVAATSV